MNLTKVYELMNSELQGVDNRSVTAGSELKAAYNMVLHLLDREITKQSDNAPIWWSAGKECEKIKVSLFS